MANLFPGENKLFPLLELAYSKQGNYTGLERKIKQLKFVCIYKVRKEINIYYKNDKECGK